MCIRDRFELDTRDHKVIPSKGVNWVTTARHLSGIGSTPYSVTQLNSDLTFHINIINNWLTLANRVGGGTNPVSYTHLRAHETVLDLVCRLLLEKKNTSKSQNRLDINTHTDIRHKLKYNTSLV